MKLRVVVAALAIVLLGVSAYPPTPRENTADTYFGTVVPDPYRWLEAVQSVRVRRWATKQNEFAGQALGRIANRAKIRSLANALEHFKADFAPGDPTAIYLQEYRSKKHGREMALWVAGKYRDFPAAAYGLKGSWALSTSLISPNKKRVAYAIENAGNGWFRWRFLDVATGRPLPDEIVGNPDWAPPSWAKDSNGFYYGGYATEVRRAGAPIGQGYRSMFHRLRTEQRADVLIYSREGAPNELTFAYETIDGTYLIAGSLGGSGDSVGVRRTSDPHSSFHTLLALDNTNLSYIYNRGSKGYFFTNDGAGRGKIVTIDLDSPGEMRDLIPESDAVLTKESVSGNRFVLTYLRDGYDELVVFSLDGRRIRRVSLPGRGTTSFEGDPSNSRASYLYTDFTECGDTFRYNTSTGAKHKISGFRQMLTSRKYVTEELFAQSTNGVRFPIFVVHRRGLKLDGKTPTLLSGYGGFDDSWTPMCLPLSRLWLANGGTFAWADVRGGGEYGETWHRDGMLENKHHSFEDFAAAAQLLIARGFASSKTLGAYGYSGGGVLVGVTEVEHPDLFAAVVEGAGPVDVLREYTYGYEAYWAREIGSPIASPDQFRWLEAYAPLLKVKRGVSYPATLILTSRTDGTVSPAHSYKFAAALQYAQAGSAPILLRIAPAGGHDGNTAYGDWDAAVTATSFLWDNLSRRRRLTASHADSQTLSF